MEGPEGPFGPSTGQSFLLAPPVGVSNGPGVEAGSPPVGTPNGGEAFGTGIRKLAKVAQSCVERSTCSSPAGGL